MRGSKLEAGKCDRVQARGHASEMVLDVSGWRAAVVDN
jgi:hypothetical protein